MSRAELRADLDAVVTATLVRRWMDRAAPGLLADVQRGCPPARQWETARDERVRPSHAKADGQLIPGNLRFILDKPQAGPTVTGQASRAAHGAEGHHGGQSGNIARKPGEAGTEMARYPRDPALSAGNAINCFPADTPVCAPDVTAAWRAPYEGPMVTIHTRSGRVFSGTPNHPVLTGRGWVHLGCLHVGDDLACRRRRQAPASRLPPAAPLTSPVAPHVQDRPVMIGEVFDTLAVASRPRRVVRLAVDFYGDRPAADVDVVRADGLLRIAADSGSQQQADDLRLTAAYATGAGLCLAEQLGHASLAAAARDVRGSRETLALSGAGAAHAGVHGSRPTAPIHPGLDEPAGHGTAVDAIGAGQGQLGFAGLVPACNADGCRDLAVAATPGGTRGFDYAIADVVLQVSANRKWSGHVHTLSTESGIYDVAGGVVVANCRCEAVTIGGLIAATMAVTDAEAAGTVARFEVASRFPRIAESEMGDGTDPGLHFMARALARLAARLNAAGR